MQKIIYVEKSQVLAGYLEASHKEVMASSQESQGPVLAAPHKKPDQTRQAQDAKCHKRKPLTKLRRKTTKLCIPAPGNDYSTRYLTTVNKKQKPNLPSIHIPPLSFAHSHISREYFFALINLATRVAYPLFCVHVLEFFLKTRPRTFGDISGDGLGQCPRAHGLPISPSNRINKKKILELISGIRVQATSSICKINCFPIYHQ